MPALLEHAAYTGFCRTKANITATFPTTFVLRIQKPLVFRHQKVFKPDWGSEVQILSPRIVSPCIAIVYAMMFFALTPKKSRRYT